MTRSIFPDHPFVREKLIVFIAVSGGGVNESSSETRGSEHVAGLGGCPGECLVGSDLAEICPKYLMDY